MQPWGGTYPTWYLDNGAYYYAVFWSGMPDLNYRDPAVKAEMFRLGRLWLTRGVDGFRLDATRYLVEDGGGKGQADTPETHQILRDFAADVHATKPDAVLFAENTVDVPTMATYYADGLSNFDFPLASAIIEGVNTGNAGRISGTLKDIIAAYPKGVVDAPFLTNHDHTRVATVFANDAAKLRDAAAILLTLPGAPFIYYGEEVGLQNGPTDADESKRTPMPWTATGGFTTGTPWFAYAPGLATANVANETNDPSSLLSYYRNWIAARRQSRALQRGDITLLDTNYQLLAFVRDSGDERVLVIHNVTTSPATMQLPQANRFERVYADPEVPEVSGPSITMPAHSSGAWRLR